MKQNTFRPRDLLNKEVAGICGVARLTDKARADYAGEIGSYKYGADSEQDTEILSFWVFQRKFSKMQQSDSTTISNWVHGFWTTVINHLRKYLSSIGS